MFVELVSLELTISYSCTCRILGRSRSTAAFLRLLSCCRVVWFSAAECCIKCFPCLLTHTECMFTKQHTQTRLKCIPCFLLICGVALCHKSMHTLPLWYNPWRCSCSGTKKSTCQVTHSKHPGYCISRKGTHACCPRICTAETLKCSLRNRWSFGHSAKACGLRLLLSCLIQACIRILRCLRELIKHVLLYGSVLSTLGIL